jgi:hypothetical protein
MAAAHNKIKCDHREDTIFRGEQLIPFPILRTVRKLKKKKQVLTNHILWRLAEVYRALPPAGFKEIHHCEKLTVYQKSKSTQRHFVVKV